MYGRYSKVRTLVFPASRLSKCAALAALLLLLAALGIARGEQYDYIVVEAESAEEIVAPMVKQVEDEKVCSAGGYIEIPLQEPRGTDKVNGKAVLKFNVKIPGKYHLYARCWWYDGCGNSFGITVDDLPKATLTDSTEKHWHWVKLRGEPLLLLPGEHKLTISNSEDGARCDQLFLTNQPEGGEPMGIEEATEK